MSRFNNYFTSGFSGCKLVATGYDPHRERDVRMFLIPGHIDVLGVTDTVDSWIAPLSSPFLEKVAKAVASHFAGHPPAFPIVLGTRPGAPDGPRAGVRVRLRATPPEDPQPARKRVKLLPPEEPRKRVRVTLK